MSGAYAEGASISHLLLAALDSPWAKSALPWGIYLRMAFPKKVHVELGDVSVCLRLPGGSEGWGRDHQGAPQKYAERPGVPDVFCAVRSLKSCEERRRRRHPKMRSCWPSCRTRDKIMGEFCFFEAAGLGAACPAAALRNGRLQGRVTNRRPQPLDMGCQ